MFKRSKKREPTPPEFIFTLEPNRRNKLGRGYSSGNDVYRWVAYIAYKNESGAIQTIGIKYGDAPKVLSKWLDEWPDFFKDAIKFHNAVKAEEEQEVKTWKSKKVCVVKSEDDVDCVYK